MRGEFDPRQFFTATQEKGAQQESRAKLEKLIERIGFSELDPEQKRQFRYEIEEILKKGETVMQKTIDDIENRFEEARLDNAA